jgi:hypothetical protein
MLTATQIAGFVGAGLAGAAYVPQISHLIRARCSAGISRLAFEVWLLASILTTARAIAIGAGVFIVLGGIQIVASALITVYAARYQGTSCPVHLPGQPAAQTATEAGTSGNEPCSPRPVGRWRHQPHPPGPSGREPDVQAARSRPKSPIAAEAPGASVARPGRSRPCTEFRMTHLKETT